MAWTIAKHKVGQQTETKISFPEEKKQAVFYDGKLSSVTINGVKILYPDGKTPTSITGADGQPLVGTAARKALNAAENYLQRIENNSLAFAKNAPDKFDANMLDWYSGRLQSRADILAARLELNDAKKKVTFRNNNKPSTTNEPISPELAVINGDMDAYNRALKQEEDHMFEVYGLSPNAKRPDGKLTEADMKKLKEAYDKMYENIGFAQNLAAARRGKIATRGGGR